MESHGGDHPSPTNVLDHEQTLQDCTVKTHIPSVASPRLCEICREIDFERVLKNLDAVHRTGGKLWERICEWRYSPDCDLCHLLVSHSNLMGGTWGLYSTSLSLQSLSMPFEATILGDVLQLVIRLEEGGPVKMSRIYCILAGDDFRVLSQRRIPEQMTDYGIARAWIKTCLEYHGPCCRIPPPHIDGLRLLDCKTMVVEKARRASCWVALSYVWGVSSHPPESTHIADAADVNLNGTCSLSRASLPLTIRDAITVVEQLGYRYLWVDELCINQRNKTHRDDQIGKMDQIYQGAELTIVAAAGDNKHHGLPGVSTARWPANEIVHLEKATILGSGPYPERAIRQSKWSKRASTLQEGELSRRLLVFSDHEMSFVCQTASWTESVNVLETSKRSIFPTYAQPLFFNHRDKSTLQRFMSLASKYSQREMTLPTDVLSAFSGLMRSMRQEAVPVYNIQGLPFCIEYLVGSGKTVTLSVEQTLLVALSWYGTSRQRRAMFPSWTWASWYGRAAFICASGRNHSNPLRSCLRNARLEGSDQLTVELSAESNRNLSNDDFQATLDRVTVLHFEASVLPATCIQVHTYEQDDGHQHDTLRVKTILIAGRAVMIFSVEHIPEQELAQQMKSGAWSWLLLGSCEDYIGHSYTNFNFVLIVQWVDDDTAERVAGFYFITTGTEEEDLRTAQEEFEWRRVRLI